MDSFIFIYGIFQVPGKFHLFSHMEFSRFLAKSIMEVVKTNKWIYPFYGEGEREGEDLAGGRAGPTCAGIGVWAGARMDLGSTGRLWDPRWVPVGQRILRVDCV